MRICLCFSEVEILLRGKPKCSVFFEISVWFSLFHYLSEFEGVVIRASIVLLY